MHFKARITRNEIKGILKVSNMDQAHPTIGSLVAHLQTVIFGNWWSILEINSSKGILGQAIMLRRTC